MFTLNCKGRIITLDRPLVMGILNITPDSFYSSSRTNDTRTAVEKAGEMIAEGADIIDIGGQSTRPGSKRISDTEELERVIPVIQQITRQFPHAIISIDTYYSSVAKKAVEEGAAIVNDISTGSFDPKILSTVASLKVPYIAMHIKGTPETMHEQYNYENVTLEVLDYFIAKKHQLKQQGIIDVIIDPGFGFSKSALHNFTLLKELSSLNMLDCPILAGLSRKSTIYKTLDISVEEALNGTTVMNTIALMNGAKILRVHDVKEAREAVTLFMKCS